MGDTAAVCPEAVTLKAQEFDRLVKKLQFQVRDTKDRHAWFIWEGRTIVRTKRSHGSGDVPFHHKIVKQMHLTETEFKDALDCAIDCDGYVEILRKRGLI